MTDHSGPASVPDKRVLRMTRRLSLFCALAGLAVLIGGFIVLSTSVFDEMSASANLVIPGEFVRSLLPAAGVAGIVHLGGCRRRVRGAKVRRGARGAWALRAGSGCECFLPWLRRHHPCRGPY